MNYQNPYQGTMYQQNQQYQYHQPQYHQQQYTDAIYVNGINEAASWVVQRGQSVRLWDSSEPKFYIKTVGDNGMPNPIETYRYERVEAAVTQEAKKEEYVTKAEFEKRISDLERSKWKNKEEHHERNAK